MAGGKTLELFAIATQEPCKPQAGGNDRQPDDSLPRDVDVPVALKLLGDGEPAGRLARSFDRCALVGNRRPLRAAGHPLFGLLLLAAVLYGTHFSPLYERSLENASVHAWEHVLYLTAGLVFWNPIFAVAPAPHAPSHPVRILALFLSLPVSAFLGFAFYVTRHVLYAH